MTVAIEITGIRVRRAMAPIRRVLNTRVGRFTKGPFLLIDLELKGGGVGRALCFTFIPLAQKLVPVLLDELVAAVEGRAFGYDEAAAIHDLGEKRLTHIGHEGLAKMALSMFDMAVHDALARAAGVPLYQLLGGKRESLPTYNSCGLGLMAPADVAREGKELVAEHGGFSHIKLRMGRERAEEEVTAYKAVRSAVGPDITISCDFNQGLPAATALDTCRAIDGLGLAWIEEPVVYDDYDTQARLATKLATPIQIGENWWSWRVGKAAIEMGACDYDHAGPAAHRRRHRLDAARPRGGGARRAVLLAPVARLFRARARRDADPALARVHGLGPGPARRSAAAREGLHHAARCAGHGRRVEREGHRAMSRRRLTALRRCMSASLAS